MCTIVEGYRSGFRVYDGRVMKKDARGVVLKTDRSVVVFIPENGILWGSDGEKEPRPTREEILN